MDEQPRLRQKELAARYVASWGEECPCCGGDEGDFFMLAAEGQDDRGRKWTEHVCWGCHLHWRVTYSPPADDDFGGFVTDSGLTRLFSDIVAFRLMSHDGLAAMPKRPPCSSDREDDDDDG